MSGAEPLPATIRFSPPPLFVLTPAFAALFFLAPFLAQLFGTSASHDIWSHISQLPTIHYPQPTSSPSHPACRPACSSPPPFCASLAQFGFRARTVDDTVFGLHHTRSIPIPIPIAKPPVQRPESSFICFLSLRSPFPPLPATSTCLGPLSAAVTPPQSSQAHPASLT